MRRGRGKPRFDHVPASALVAIGAMTGASLRWAVGESAAAVGLSLSIAIMSLNVAGSALVGWLSGRRHRDGPLWPLAAVGFAGGLTTFSGYAVDIALRLDGGDATTSAGFGTATVVLALLAAFIAHDRAAKSLSRPHR